MFRSYYSSLMYKVGHPWGFVRANSTVQCNPHVCPCQTGAASAHSAPPKLTHPSTQAILAATQRSFAAIKRRVGSHASTGIFFLERPFFDVNVELKVGGRDCRGGTLAAALLVFWGFAGHFAVEVHIPKC
jgi:hypothetical protein